MDINKFYIYIFFQFTIGNSYSQTRNISHARNTTHYELINHLGNVLATISDSKKVGSNEVTILTTSDYYAFGMEIKERSYSLGGVFRYGYNGKENDRDWGTGLIQDYGFRLYNPAVGRFLSVDPVNENSENKSTYLISDNKPINHIDFLGLFGDPRFSTSVNLFIGLHKYQRNRSYSIGGNIGLNLNKAGIGASVNFTNSSPGSTGNSVSQISFYGAKIIPMNDSKTDNVNKIYYNTSKNINSNYTNYSNFITLSYSFNFQNSKEGLNYSWHPNGGLGVGFKANGIEYSLAHHNDLFTIFNPHSDHYLTGTGFLSKQTKYCFEITGETAVTDKRIYNSSSNEYQTTSIEGQKFYEVKNTELNRSESYNISNQTNSQIWSSFGETQSAIHSATKDPYFEHLGSLRNFIITLDKRMQDIKNPKK